MQSEEARLLESVGATAREVPRSIVQQLCDVLTTMEEDAPQDERISLLTNVASPGARARTYDLLRAWDSAPAVSPTSLAWALRAASDADERRRHEQTIELVWTGPSPEGTVLRRTDQVLLDLIRSARHTLHVVTFAAYKIPILNEAMLAAARRGVEISLIFETADAGKVSFAATKAVGEELEALCSIYIWPPDERPRDSAGRYGSLHAKCAVADTDAVLISSANLTEYALALNMELGLLVRGGGLPNRLVAHLRQLIEANVLTRL